MSANPKSSIGVGEKICLSVALFLFCAALCAGGFKRILAPSPSFAAGPAGTPESLPGNASTVYIASLQGIVGVPMEEYVDGIFKNIGNTNALLIFRMDTPGGLVDSMSHIMSQIAGADFPVVVWVAPGGARAASAGAFITMSAHVAAMAPETNIGAAHPVTGGGKDIEDSEMNRKVMNDLTAKIRAFAQERHRNTSVAESMVTDSVSLTAQEAFEQYLIDFVASDENELFEKLNGFEVNIKGSPRIILTDNREIIRVDMPLRLRALAIFSRPDIAYLALIAGILLIILEVRTPGGFVAGIFGGLLLIIAAYGLRMLPVNFAGVALLIGGIIVIIADIAIGGIGVMAVPGFIAMLFGGLLLYRAPGGELLRVSYGFITGVTCVTGVIFLVILRLVYKALRRKPAAGSEAMIGTRAKVLDLGADDDGTKKMALVHGEYWRISEDESSEKLSPGDEIEIVGVESMTLKVRRVTNQNYNMR
ncbi:MAG: ATP-dependent Clp protease proteolytic subunit [Synergistaceae bacterium]|jgi:membrane-bound serine protease (ClpP class)|nr:ATP-dependent Clp protease proteolytic subunit [Synergistaceae bacterium]